MVYDKSISIIILTSNPRCFTHYRLHGTIILPYKTQKIHCPLTSLYQASPDVASSSPSRDSTTWSLSRIAVIQRHPIDAETIGNWGNRLEILALMFPQCLTVYSRIAMNTWGKLNNMEGQRSVWCAAYLPDQKVLASQTILRCPGKMTCLWDVIRETTSDKEWIYLDWRWGGRLVHHCWAEKARSPTRWRECIMRTYCCCRGRMGRLVGKTRCGPEPYIHTKAPYFSWT